MGDSPMRSLQSKPDSSINKGFDFLIQEKIDGFASAGNTGAVIAGAVIKVGVLQEGLRPCLMATLPKLEFRDGIILDIGANADTKPENLLQFAILGQNYAQHILGYSNPTVGLLNIGSEPDKGSESTKAAYKLLEDSPSVNFIGNVEGNDLFTSEADVIVTPGFTGNIVTKLCEHWYSIFKKSGFSTAFLDKFDFEKHGGSPVLGVKKPVLKGHGSSSSRAIKHLIIATAEVAKTKLSEKISNSLVNA
jgi:glycerol-3-phosphate acyltransferase PlsX